MIRLRSSTALLQLLIPNLVLNMKRLDNIDNLFEDKLNAPLIGRHRLDGTFFWETDKYRLNLFGAKALDIDSSTFFIDASYRLSKIWRIGASYSADRFNKNFVEDQTLILAYRIGIREFAITYSIDEDRFGFEIFNVPIR